MSDGFFPPCTDHNHVVASLKNKLFTNGTLGCFLLLASALFQIIGNNLELVDLSSGTMAGLEWAGGKLFTRWLSRSHHCCIFSRKEPSMKYVQNQFMCCGGHQQSCFHTSFYAHRSPGVFSAQGSHSENAACVPASFTALSKLNKERTTFWV